MSTKEVFSMLSVKVKLVRVEQFHTQAEYEKRGVIR
jgi:hypothetical protein